MKMEFLVDNQVLLDRLTKENHLAVFFHHASNYIYNLAVLPLSLSL